MTAGSEDLAKDLDDAKAIARKHAKAQRAEAVVPGAGVELAAGFFAGIELSAAQVVSVFWPLEGEIDTLPLMKGLHERRCQVVLPVMQGAGLPLIFRTWSPGDKLDPAGYGTQEPRADKPLADPSLLVVPLLAFDRHGYRLGYGGGFYDRTLQRLRAAASVTTVGIAFAGQEVAAVPRGPYDQRLDFIVTEREVIEVG